MKKFFFAHPDVVLSIIAIVLLITLIGFFSSAINSVVFEMKHASMAVGAQPQQGFDLRGAASLNFHGISTSTTSTVGGSAANGITTTSVTTSTTRVTTSTPSSSPLHP